MNNFQKDLEVFNEKIVTANQLIATLNRSNDVLIASKSKLDTLDKVIGEVELRHQTLINAFKSENTTLIAKTDANWQTKILRMEEDFASIKKFYGEFKNQLEAFFGKTAESIQDNSLHIRELIKISNDERLKDSRNTFEHLNQLQINQNKTNENVGLVQKDLAKESSRLIEAIEIYGNQTTENLNNLSIQTNNALNKQGGFIEELNLRTKSEIESLNPLLQEIHQNGLKLSEFTELSKAELVVLYEKMQSANSKRNSDLKELQRKLYDQSVELIEKNFNDLKDQNLLDLGEINKRIDDTNESIESKINFLYEKIDENHLNLNELINKKAKILLYVFSVEIIIAVSVLIYVLNK